MHPAGKRLLARLERHWHPHYSAREVHRRVVTALVEIRGMLRHNSENARIVSRTLKRIALRERIPPEEMEAANLAFQEMLKAFGFAVASILPGAFLTLPVLYALSRHLDIELLPESGTRERKSADENAAD